MDEFNKKLKQRLICIIDSKMDNLQCINAEELGEVIDILKDIEQAEYYHAVVQAMESGGNYSYNSVSVSKNCACEAKKHFMNTKEHQWLEKYIHHVTSDITQMLTQSTAEDKQMLRLKLNELINMI